MLTATDPYLEIRPLMLSVDGSLPPAIAEILAERQPRRDLDDATAEHNAALQRLADANAAVDDAQTELEQCEDERHVAKLLVRRNKCLSARASAAAACSAAELARGAAQVAYDAAGFRADQRKKLVAEYLKLVEQHDREQTAALQSVVRKYKNVSAARAAIAAFDASARQ